MSCSMFCSQWHVFVYDGVLVQIEKHANNEGQHLTWTFKHILDIIRYILVEILLSLLIEVPPSGAMPSLADLPTELEIQIFEHLAEDKRALNSVIRVNRAWNMHAINLLWRHASAQDLAKIELLPRRQNYADTLIKLNVKTQQCYQRFRFLLFTALTEVILDPPLFRSTPVIRSIRLRPYLQSTLRKLHLEPGFVLTEDALDMISLCCPLLEDLKLSSRHVFGDSDEYLTHSTFNLPKLSRLVLAWEYKYSSSALKRLGHQLPSLEHLEVRWHDLDVWEQKPSMAVFPRLKFLEVDCPPYSPRLNFDEDCEKTVADEYLSTLLRLAPMLETFCLGWMSRIDGMNWARKEMSIVELRELC